MTATVFVTGASGRIGQRVAALLNAQSVPWRAMLRRPQPASSLAATEVAQASFEAPEAMQQAMKGIQTVVLISGDAPNQADLELAAVDAAKQARVMRIVKLSAQSAGLSPPVSFGKHHAAVEAGIKQSGLAWTFMRPVFFQQSFLLFADSVRKNNKLILPAGKGACAFVDAQDVAECLVQAATQTGHEGKTYTLTGPQSMSFAEAGKLIGQLRGKPVGYIAPPAWLARVLLPKAAGMPRWLANEVVDLMQAIGKGAQAPTRSDVQTVLNKTARRFDDFVKNNLASFK